jgi:hypothetical protein
VRSALSIDPGVGELHVLEAAAGEVDLLSRRFSAVMCVPVHAMIFSWLQRPLSKFSSFQVQPVNSLPLKLQPANRLPVKVQASKVQPLTTMRCRSQPLNVQFANWQPVHEASRKVVPEKLLPLNTLPEKVMRFRSRPA